MDYIIKDGELYHHGVLGQKWGVRRFQNKDGSLTDAGKKRISRKQKKALEKARKAKHDKAEAAKKAKQEQEDFEKNKKRVLESGSAAEVAKYKGKLTNQELQQVVSRLNMEQRISELAAIKEPSKIEKLTAKIDKANNLTDKSITGWNNVAKILNSTVGTDLPIIKEGSKQKDKAVKKITKTAEEVANKAAKDQQKKEAKEAKEEAKKAKKAEKAEKEKETYTGEVVGEGTSKRENNSSKKRRNLDDVVVTDWDDVTESAGKSYTSGLLTSSNKGSTTVAGLLSAPNQKYIDSGSNYIAGLLAPPKDRDD